MFRSPTEFNAVLLKCQYIIKITEAKMLGKKTLKQVKENEALIIFYDDLCRFNAIFLYKVLAN